MQIDIKCGKIRVYLYLDIISNSNKINDLLGGTIKMMTSAEMKFVVPKGWVVNEKVMPDGSRVFTAKPDDTTCHQRKGIFKLVPASQLSLEDGWMKHQPKTEAERNFKELVETAIKRGLKDFWRPVCDPSFDDNGRICYEPGKMPAVGENYNWWAKTAKEFKPEKESRLGTKTEYIAFLAVLIKELVNSGKSVKWAWNAVCNNSKELGHYWNSENAKHAFEDTGSREICGWCDLANSFKILAEDEKAGGFWLAGGNYYYFSYDYPLAASSHNRKFDFSFGCGWLVFDRCPDC